MKQNNKNFFLWGAATSSYQVEGGIKNDWTRAGFDSGRAADHYSRFKEDFDLAKELGHNAHRFSIEWSRIEPEEGKFDKKEIEHYRKVVTALQERGLEPFVTLWHFTNPVWFAESGGFESPKAVFYFERYINFVTENLKDVKFWITINEPMVYTKNSYWLGIWPPGRPLSPLSYFRAIKNLIQAHKKASVVIKKVNPRAQVGIAKNIIYFEEDKHPWHYLQKLGEYWWNEYFLNKIFDHQDFVGLNYYFHKHIRRETHPVSDLGWGIYPEGLYQVLGVLKKYNKPIYVTENGIADAKDEKRAQFIKDHIDWMKKAMAEGVDVRGYFYWSLLDNFEWEKGFGPRFGLIEVDYKTMRRKIRGSAYLYKYFIKHS
ncbi:MAG: family 1 glycosylhydrolase [Candidatus Harrisonbacteria bacterium]|nr:family 1 glycosylhydrolase [Candidatus Harrisonbacteria bacterium]